MTTSNSESLVVTLPSDLEVLMTRTVNAPRDLVFKAFTEPEHVRRWLLGPEGWSMPVCEIDLRVGGAWRYVWRNDAEDKEFGMGGVYREIEAPARIVNTEVFEQAESVNTLTLTEVDGGTLISQRMVLESREARDGAVASGMADGVEASYQRLEAHLNGTKV